MNYSLFPNSSTQIEIDPSFQYDSKMYARNKITFDKSNIFSNCTTSKSIPYSGNFKLDIPVEKLRVHFFFSNTFDLDTFFQQFETNMYITESEKSSKKLLIGNMHSFKNFTSKLIQQYRSETQTQIVEMFSTNLLKYSLFCVIGLSLDSEIDTSALNLYKYSEFPVYYTDDSYINCLTLPPSWIELMAEHSILKREEEEEEIKEFNCYEKVITEREFNNYKNKKLNIIGKSKEKKTETIIKEIKEEEQVPEIKLKLKRKFGARSSLKTINTCEPNESKEIKVIHNIKEADSCLNNLQRINPDIESTQKAILINNFTDMNPIQQNLGIDSLEREKSRFDINKILIKTLIDEAKNNSDKNELQIGAEEGIMPRKFTYYISHARSSSVILKNRRQSNLRQGMQFV